MSFWGTAWTAMAQALPAPSPGCGGDPGTISAQPVADPDLGRPHVQAPTMALPPNSSTVAADLKRRVLAAKRIVERELPGLVAHVLCAELDWLNNSTWAKSSGHIEAFLAEVESLDTRKEAA